MFPIMHNTVNSNFGSLCVVIGRGCTKYNPRYAMFRLGFKYSPYIFLTFSGLWITDGGFYIFTLALWDFSTLSSTEKHQALHCTEQQQKYCYKPPELQHCKTFLSHCHYLIFKMEGLYFLSLTIRL